MLEITQQYRTSIEKGLDSEQAAKRITEYGKNTLTPPPKRWLRKFTSYFFGGFCGILWIASIICWYDGSIKYIGELVAAKTLLRI